MLDLVYFNNRHISVDNTSFFQAVSVYTQNGPCGILTAKLWVGTVGPFSLNAEGECPVFILLAASLSLPLPTCRALSCALRELGKPFFGSDSLKAPISIPFSVLTQLGLCDPIGLFFPSVGGSWY